jgi:hypothetical protein
MTREELIKMNKHEVYDFIRERLTPIDKKTEIMLSPHGGGWGTYNRNLKTEYCKINHRRFERSGYDGDNVGSCTLHNLSILNTFADLGIYDYSYYLFLDFFKGMTTLYMRYWENDSKNIEFIGDNDYYVGWGTTDIIYDIFEKTIFSGKEKRRRQH